MTSKQIKVPDRILFAWLMLAGLILFFAPEKWSAKVQLVFARIFCQPLSISRDISLSALMQVPSSELVSRSQYNLLRNDLANIKQWLALERTGPSGRVWIL
jgi:hypothetical protein